MPARRGKNRAAWEAHAKSHPVRRSILALYEQDEQRSLAAQDLLPKLDDEAMTRSSVAYHVMVLRHSGLLPDS